MFTREEADRRWLWKNVERNPPPPAGCGRRTGPLVSLFMEISGFVLVN